MESSPLNQAVPMLSEVSHSAGLTPLELTLTVTDPDVIAELMLRDDAERRLYASTALRLGVLVMRSASGQIDATEVKRAADLLMSDLRSALNEHKLLLDTSVVATIQDYFDPANGHLTKRLSQFIASDGELASAIERQAGLIDQKLARTLTERIGESSPIFKLLSPTETDGLKAQIEASLDSLFGEQRQAVTAHFTLDDPKSPLSLLKASLEGTISNLTKSNVDFQTELLAKLESQKARKAAEARSTTHGRTFEDALCDLLTVQAQRFNDVPTPCGAKPGKTGKKGDFTITLNEESAAPGSVIVWEAKEKERVSLDAAITELREAKENRSAQVGVFVFSKVIAPETLERFQRINGDLFVVWDQEEPASDVIVSAAYSLARAMCVKESAELAELGEQIVVLDKHIVCVEKLVRGMASIRKKADTVAKYGTEVAKEIDDWHDVLNDNLARLRDCVSALNQL